MEYLELEEIRSQQNSIRTIFDSLMTARAVVGRPNAKQWRFLASCLEKLFNPEKKTDFDETGKTEAAQLKFEVEDKLRRFYLRPGLAMNYVFSLVHHSQLSIYGIEQSKKYPSMAGYCLLIRKIFADNGNIGYAASELRQYLEKVVTECIDAEFRAYQQLPEVNRDELLHFFAREGPAFSEIYNLLVRHKKKGWIISNQFNPSTKRLLNIKVSRVQRKEAVVKTREYWYIRWYDSTTNSYVYPYRETNQQQYILRCVDTIWKVYQNIRPSPRTSIPLRWNRR